MTLYNWFLDEQNSAIKSCTLNFAITIIRDVYFVVFENESKGTKLSLTQLTLLTCALIAIKDERTLFIRFLLIYHKLLHVLVSYQINQENTRTRNISDNCKWKSSRLIQEVGCVGGGRAGCWERCSWKWTISRVWRHQTQECDISRPWSVVPHEWLETATQTPVICNEQ